MVDVNAVILIVGFVTIIGVVVGVLVWLKADMHAMEARLTANAEQMETRLTANAEQMEARLRAEMQVLRTDTIANAEQMEARLTADIADLKTEHKVLDERQRVMQSDISFVKGALTQITDFRVEIPDYTPPEEQPTEAVGD
ncbi:MAG: hypothetical protein OXI16_13880 [Chloroflexota bacterium]|nr:hypothetical protein [Chloroflexota bacterium]